MESWFRFYDKTAHDRTIGWIAKQAGMPKATVIGAWTVILCTANSSPTPGTLMLTVDMPIDESILADEMGLSSEQALDLMELFQDVGMICLTGGAYQIDNWPHYKAPDSRKLSSRWRRIREQTLARDGYVCRYCGAEATTVDHIIPSSQGGTDDPENLVAACVACNCSKGGRTPEQAGMEVLHG